MNENDLVLTVQVSQDQLEDGAADLAYILRQLADDITGGDGNVYRVNNADLLDDDDTILCRYTIS